MAKTQTPKTASVAPVKDEKAGKQVSKTMGPVAKIVNKQVKKSVGVKAPAKPAPKKVDAKPVVKSVSKAGVKPDLETKDKPKKAKLVRDSFTMPEAEYAVLGDVKKACLKAGIEVKKSELLRVGVALIRELDIVKLKEILAGLPALKAGRPKKSK